MPHYRVTRPETYGPGTPGYTDLGARQGYYTDADSPDAARDIIDSRLRKDKWSSYRPGEALDVQTWGRGTGEPSGPPDLSPLGYNRAHGIT